MRTIFEYHTIDFVYKIIDKEEKYGLDPKFILTVNDRAILCRQTPTLCLLELENLASVFDFYFNEECFNDSVVEMDELLRGGAKR